MDLNKILNENNEKKHIKKYKKPNQLRDIESKSNNNRNNLNKYETHTMDEMNHLINKEKKDIMKQSWNKLNNGYKLKLLSEFIESKKKELKLTNNESLKLKKILFSACENNKLNKNNNIIYDKQNNKIKEIKILEINEKNEFKLKIQDKKKTNTKSKTNIEKLLKINK